MTSGACNYCGHCERFGCHVGAKASPVTTVIPSALKSGRVEVRPFSDVFRINHTDGQATSVSYYDQNGIEQEQPADLIVMGSFTLNNIRLLLMSKIGQPYDPQANTGVVGRNFTHQLGGAGASGWFDDRTLNRFMGSGANGVGMDEYQLRQLRPQGPGLLRRRQHLDCGQRGTANPEHQPAAGRSPVGEWLEGGRQAVLRHLHLGRYAGRARRLPTELRRPRPDLPRRARQPAPAHHAGLDGQ